MLASQSAYLRMQADAISTTKSRILVHSLYQYLVYARSEGSGESAHLRMQADATSTTKSRILTSSLCRYS